MWQQLLVQIRENDAKALARSISLVENEADGYEHMLSQLKHHPAARIIGITGPPGAGKSTLVDGLIEEILKKNKKVAVLCVDPSSPFHFGAVLGDRIRMNKWYTDPRVFIRSMATRGSMGGLNAAIIEITDVVKEAGFDFIIVETVGVGQSEIEIAGLADVTVVVLVPEAGDEVQTMKSGLMEIADIFVVNKSDRPDADAFAKNLRTMLAPAFSAQRNVPVIKTVASEHAGVDELLSAISGQLQAGVANEKKVWMLTEKALHLIQKERMKDIDRTVLEKEIRQKMGAGDFNLYRLVNSYTA